MLEYFIAIWSILRPFGIFVAIWYILWSFGKFFPLCSVVCTKKNLATLFATVVKIFEFGGSKTFLFQNSY
jgi:hypothetical protein